MFNFLHSFLPSPVLLDLGFIKVHWYGLIMAGAFFVCSLTLARLSRLNKSQLIDLAFWLIIFGLVGARIWHILFYNLSYFLDKPVEIVKIWNGGLAIHGAIAAGFPVVYLFSRKRQLNFFKLTDALVVVLPLGQAIGRWGNYFNQELYGRACDFSWCLPIAGQPGYWHPVFLYESLLNLILFILLLFWFKLDRLPLRALTFMYLLGYSIIRFSMEFLRLDIVSTCWGLNWLQWLCLALTAVSGFFLLKLLPKRAL